MSRVKYIRIHKDKLKVKGGGRPFTFATPIRRLHYNDDHLCSISQSHSSGKDILTNKYLRCWPLFCLGFSNEEERCRGDCRGDGSLGEVRVGVRRGRCRAGRMGEEQEALLKSELLASYLHRRALLAGSETAHRDLRVSCSLPNLAACVTC